MDEYTLVNPFMKRYETGGHRMVRILMVESFVLKKKRECDREEEEGGTREEISTEGHRRHWRLAICRDKA
jgi:hypothetical protein